MAHGKTTSLVLLPSPPEPPSPESLSAAYRPTLEMALSRTSNKAESESAVLLVAVCYPYTEEFVWGDAQELLAGLYSLIVVLCKEQQIETGMDDGPGSVDTRVVLLENGTYRTNNGTALVDLHSLAAAHGSWHSVFYPESKAGLQLRDQYLMPVSEADRDNVAAVAGGLTLRTGGTAGTTPAAAPPTPTALHKTVCLGGTFDYLHPGHKLLLTAGALLLRVPPPSASDNPQPCEYVIGITGDEMLRKKKYAELVQSWSTRARAVADFLATILDLPSARAPQSSRHSHSKMEEKDGELRATFRNGSISLLCVRIEDGFGPTIAREDMTCLVVSGETQSGGEAINKKRKEQGWQPLETFVVDVLNADGMAAAKDKDDKPTVTEAFDAKISSSEIRRRRAERAAVSTQD